MWICVLVLNFETAVLVVKLETETTTLYNGYINDIHGLVTSLICIMRCIVDIGVVKF